MGKTDTVIKEYLKDPRIFADAFNKYLYHGNQVIKPEDWAWNGRRWKSSTRQQIQG